jgi:hypothetical protein
MGIQNLADVFAGKWPKKQIQLTVIVLTEHKQGRTQFGTQ